MNAERLRMRFRKWRINRRVVRDMRNGKAAPYRAADAAATCPHCPDGHRDPLTMPWSAWVASERDSDGQPTHLVVTKANGAHVAESDAEWIRELIHSAQTRPERFCGNPKHPHGPDYPRWLCRMGRKAKTPAWRPWWKRPADHGPLPSPSPAATPSEVTR